MKKVPYHTVCSCNPINGGSGVCGCIMANTLVDVDDNWPNTIQQDKEYKYCPHCGEKL